MVTNITNIIKVGKVKLVNIDTMIIPNFLKENLNNTNMQNTIEKTHKRIDVVDCLRGFAVVGIIMLHYLEHLNFYSFPEPSAFEQGLWDTMWYLFSSKMYAIFALLFGLTCFIQHRNQKERGYDFRPRFAWRMVLLFLWGLLDLVFFNGDVLVTYSVLGLLLIPFVRASDRTVIIAAFVLYCQPIEMVYVTLGLLNENTRPMDLGLGSMWGELFTPCAEGGFLDVAKANLTYGLQLNYGWALEHGRLTQTLLFFLIGMLLGRKGLFANTESNAAFWRKAIQWAALLFASMQILLNTVSFTEMQPAVGQGLETLITAWRNFAMTTFYVSCFTLLYYHSKASKALTHLSFIGKMSLTDYLLQSIIGSFLFYNWGLSLHLVSSHGISFLLGIATVICLYIFCRYWTKHHRRGPLEQIWSKLTWVNK